MVALDNSALFDTRRFRPRLSIVSFTTAACALLTLGAIAANGFDENALRAGSEMAWRFTFFVFFAAIIAGPLARLLPFAPLQYLGEREHQLLWGFCASFAVYLAMVLVPNTIRPVSISHEGLTGGMMLFIGFSAMLVAVIAYSITDHARAGFGDPSRRAILAAGIGYFWLSYSLTGLAHISGPHRPDMFFGLSLSLMVVALLLRFADNFMAKLKIRNAEPAIASSP